MKKVLMIGMLALLSAGTAMAQDLVEFGVKAGVNTTNFDVHRKKLGDGMRAFGKARTGYHAGAFMRLNLPLFFVQPEFLYNWNGYDLTTVGVSDGAIDDRSSRIKVQTLEVPVLAGKRLAFLRINAGPVFNIMNKTSRSGGLVERADVLKPSVGYSAGLGLDMMGACLDIRYNGLFEKAKQTVEIGGTSHRLDTGFSGWTFSLGYTF